MRLVHMYVHLDGCHGDPVAEVFSQLLMCFLYIRSVRCKVHGPLVKITPLRLNWGVCPVLTPLEKTFTIDNESLIPAVFNCTLVSKGRVEGGSHWGLSVQMACFTNFSSSPIFPLVSSAPFPSSSFSSLPSSPLPSSPSPPFPSPPLLSLTS